MKRQLSAIALTIGATLVAPVGHAQDYVAQPEPGKRPELFAPGIVNRDTIEINGVFAPDGERFYFARMTGGVFSILESRRGSDGWSEPEVLSVYEDDRRATAVDMTLSPDGRSMYFLGKNSHGAPEGPPDLWVMHRSGDGWSKAEPLPEPINSPAAEYYPVVVADGSLYFVSTREGGMGSADIYRAQRRADGSFEAPVNLGPAINTPYTDFCPMMTPDGRYFFFSRRLGTGWDDAPDAQILWADSAILDNTAPEQAVVNSLAQRFVDGQIGGGILFWEDDERRIGFRNLEAIYPTRTVSAGDTPYPLGKRPMDLRDVTYSVDGEAFTVGDFLDDPSSMGLLVVQGGDVIAEHYAPGHDRDTPWVSFSVTKSVTSMLIGAAVADGYIDSVDEPVTAYLPRLRGGAYEGASIADVLHMASGAAWDEDYADPRSDVALAGGLNGLDLVRYLADLRREHPPGEVFNYNTGETNLVGEILRSAIGNNAATYLSAKIWKPFGMERDANWVLGSVDGGELGGCCISATLRDYARIGLFVLSGGVLPDGRRILPEGWMASSTTPSTGDDGYGYLWWLNGDGSFAASGIFGQRIHIDPARDLVIALHSNAPTAVGSDYHSHIGPALEAISDVFQPTQH